MANCNDLHIGNGPWSKVQGWVMVNSNRGGSEALIEGGSYEGSRRWGELTEDYESKRAGMGISQAWR